MTFVWPNLVIYENRKYEILSQQAKGMPKPEDFGLEIGIGHSGNWHGYRVTLICVEGEVRLKKLHLSGEILSQNGKALEGKEVEPLKLRIEKGPDDPDDMPESITLGRNFDDLNTPTRITGQILIGRQILRDAPRGAVQVMPYSYQEVLTLVIENGALLDVIDRSDKAEAWRQEIARYEAETTNEQRVGKFRDGTNPYVWKGKSGWFEAPQSGEQEDEAD